MKIKKIFAFLLMLIFVFTLVACGNNAEQEKKPEVDPLVPTAISLKVKTAKVQINKTLKITYAITPATAQGNAVTVTLNSDKATAVVEGTNTILLTAGPNEGNVKLTVTCTNGVNASKTIKIQVDEVKSYPDLSGYNIKLAQAVQAMGEYDVKLTKDTEDQYGYYGAADREFKQQAWDEIEDNYNCTLSVVAYPSDAPWGPARWQYILTQGQQETADYDFYVCPNSCIPAFVAGNAIYDLTDWYAEYGKNFMSDISINGGTYKQRLYSINANDLNIYTILGYNVALLEQIQQYDSTIKEPAQMYLDGDWNYTTFEKYCIKVQTALNSLFGESGDSYYCLSGYGSYYWIGLTNAGGIRVLDSVQLKTNITGVIETAAAQTMQNIYKAGCMDKSFQVDSSVASWNAGHALFNSGDWWFVNTPNRWSKTLWGEDTRYGYVPYPGSPDNDPNETFAGCTAEACIVMPTGRDWAYKGFGEDCCAENIYAAYVDYINTANAYYHNSEDYDYVSQLENAAKNKFSTEASVKAYLKVMLGVQQPDGTYVGGMSEYAVYDPFVANDNGVVGNCGSGATFAGGINSFIRGDINQWVDAVGPYQATIEQSLVEIFG